MKVIMWWKLSSDEIYQVIKVIKWWKLPSDESYQMMKVIKWWKLSSDEDDEDDDDDEEYLTDVTLVSDDTYWRLEWCYSSIWGSVESYQAMKVIKWWKLTSDESYQLMKVINW